MMKSQTTTPDVPTPEGTSHDSVGRASPPANCGTGVSPVSGSECGTTVSPVSGSECSTTVSPVSGSECSTSEEETDALQTAEREDPNGILGEILEEMRMIRRQRQHEDFSIGKLAGAVAQAFALCSIGWALYCWTDAAANQAAASTTTIALLFGIAFQLMALTFFATAHKK